MGAAHAGPSPSVAPLAMVGKAKRPRLHRAAPRPWPARDPPLPPLPEPGPAAGGWSAPAGKVARERGRDRAARGGGTRFVRGRPPCAGSPTRGVTAGTPRCSCGREAAVTLFAGRLRVSHAAFHPWERVSSQGAKQGSLGLQCSSVRCSLCFGGAPVCFWGYRCSTLSATMVELLASWGYHHGHSSYARAATTASQALSRQRGACWRGQGACAVAQWL